MDLNKVQKILEKYKIESEEELEDILKFAIEVLSFKDNIDEFLDMIDLYFDDDVSSERQ